MNRIKYWRKKRGLSAAALAAKIGTTQPTIQRLETGKQPLKDEWMRKLAAALDIDPADLLMTAIVAGLAADIEPKAISDDPRIAGLVEARGLRGFVVLTDTLGNLGIQAGRLYMFDTTEARRAAVRTGDVVAIEAQGPDTGFAPVLLLRQFIEPGLFVTNRSGRNTAFGIDDPEIAVTVLGVMEPDRQ